MTDTPLEFDYSFLKAQGIAYIQQLAGKKWTDYGNHDPGITILEVLAFAIMDLQYRTNFYIEDLWANDPDAIEKPNEKQFYRAEEILPSHPLTRWDFLKIVLDVPGVKNANICLSDAPNDIKGGYKIFVELEKRIKHSAHETKVLELVKERLYIKRNLCEDFFLIEAMKPISISVKASFEVNNCLGYEEGEAIIAQLLYEFQEFLSPRITFYSISQLLEKGKTIDQIFTGPLLTQGFIDEAELIELKSRSSIYVVELLEKAIKVAGIKRVLHFELFVESEEGHFSSINVPILPDSFLTLNRAESNIMLSYNELPIPINAQKVATLLEDKKGRGTLTKAYLQEEELFVLEGKYRHLEDYVSIQQDFPLLYNVGHEGCAPSEPPENHAKAKQLKSYLLFFDQLFANYLGRLSNVKHTMAIYSDAWNKPAGRLPLDVPRMDDIIKQLESDPSNDLEFIVQKKYLDLKHPLTAIDRKQAIDSTGYVDYINNILESNIRSLEKRSRMLDHLLAYFAERFTIYSLHLYPKNEEKRLEYLNLNKTLFLKDYIEISRDRGRAAYSKETGEGGMQHVSSGFKQRIYRNLGIKDVTDRIFHQIIKRNMYLEKKPAHDTNLDVFLGKSYQTDYSDLFIFQGKYANMRSLVMLYGINEAYYHILKKDNAYSILLYIDKVKQNTVELITDKGAVSSLAQAEHMVQKSLTLFRSLNDQCEGFHLIEHILLRSSDTLEEVNDPYSFKMTLVFPAWPARFQQISFRHVVEEMVMTESPAHLFITVLWLSFEDMEAFEQRYQTWLQLKANATASKREIDSAATALMDCIESLSSQLNAACASS
ncbi:MAG: hypothetical protein NQ127_02925 [Candidatus Cardinium sp.]|nr:hypothetical protein [Candidatus Cardinium sp.]